MELSISPTGTWDAIIVWLAAFSATTLVGVYWNYLLPRWLRFPSAQLQYLSFKDSELGPAVISMCHHSAWAKWYCAQSLVLSGQPLNDISLLNIASSLVGQNLLDGKIEVRGRLPGDLKYEAIPQTHWRSSVLQFVRDSVTLWKMIILPTGGVEFTFDGAIVKTLDQAATQRNAVIRNYDSFIVDGAQFEKAWPKREWATDKKRYELLREARRRKLDENEIKNLSRDWNILFLFSWIK